MKVSFLNLDNISHVIIDEETKDLYIYFTSQEFVHFPKDSRKYEKILSTFKTSNFINLT